MTIETRDGGDGSLSDIKVVADLVVWRMTGADMLQGFVIVRSRVQPLPAKGITALA